MRGQVMIRVFPSISAGFSSAQTGRPVWGPEGSQLLGGNEFRLRARPVGGLGLEKRGDKKGTAPFRQVMIRVFPSISTGFSRPIRSSMVGAMSARRPSRSFTSAPTM